MKLLKIFLVIALLLTVIIPASAEKVLCFYSGNDYLEFSESTKLAYVAGLSDMANTLIQHYESKKYQKIWELTKNILLGQTVKILDKYLEEHPEELHIAVAISFLNVIDEIVFKA